MDDDYCDDSASYARTDQTTSSEQIRSLSQVSDAKKALVRTAAPRGGRCLVQNIGEECAVEFAYCIPRSLSWLEPETMSNLEWWWNLPKHTLNFDTRYNIFPVGAALHTLFNKNEWLLVPEDSVVDHYFNRCHLEANGRLTTKRANVSPMPDSTFLYTLVPVPFKMNTMWISRQDIIPTENSPLQSDHVSTHVHPFQTLPQLDSHLLPHFVIFETGRKLAALPPADLIDFTRQNPLLEMIVRIYQAWTTTRPAGAEEDVTFLPPSSPSPPSDEDSEANTDGHTQACRAHRNFQPPPQSSPTPHRKRQKLGKKGREGQDILNEAGKRKHAYHPALSLSGKTLCDHFEEGKMWTADSIRAWSDNNYRLADDSQITPD
ncbi:hypothetical protein HWV62_43967 [Athelia sp. TMB]|nr:hypothetical protein HWV62_43967 [Athelia sp. TMB]